MVKLRWGFEVVTGVQGFGLRSSGLGSPGRFV